MIYYTKATLYQRIRKFRSDLEISPEDYPLTTLDLCSKYPEIQICFTRFKTPGLKGMAFVYDRPQSDVIIVDAKQSESEQNFVITHETMHLTLHRNEPKKKFSYYNLARYSQDSYLEWQANEGAAEFLMPAYLFLKEIKCKWPCLHTSRDFEELKRYLSKRFNVTSRVIEVRYEHLKYEIFQFLSGIPYDKIKVISQIRQDKLGIDVKSLNDIEDELSLKELGGYHVTIGQ